MADTLNREDRSDLMRRVRQSGTSPELVVRRWAHRMGFRFRLGRRDLPGSPDIVFPRYRAVIFVHGCFWHRHAGCRRSSTPRTNQQFWAAKFEANVRRDELAIARLEDLGWRSLVIWECEISDGTSLQKRLRQFLT